MTDPADIVLHRQKIKATRFSAPFTEYAYNSYDIAYTKGRETGKIYLDVYLSKNETSTYAEIAAASGDIITMSAPAKKTGYDFLGWGGDENGNPFDGTGPVTQNMKLYALWMKLQSFTR